MDKMPLRDKIVLLTGTASFTVEVLANDIVDICLAAKGVEKAIVRVEKPGAVRLTKSVGVEIERSWASW
jgi:dihydroneopterin aldolase